ncbi:MAG: ATP-binding cassette domain-containing protein [Pseudomonadota bacterium]
MGLSQTDGDRLMTVLALSVAGPKGLIELTFESGETIALVGDVSQLGPEVSSLLTGSTKVGPKLVIDGVSATPAARMGREMIRRHLSMLRPVEEAPLNPRWKVLRILEEPLRALRPEMSKKARFETIASCLADLEVDVATLSAMPSALSASERQSVALARAVVAKPSLLAAVDPFARLEVEDQARLANQLLHLVSDSSVALLLILSDLAMAAHLADRIAVVSEGAIVEAGSAQDMRLIPRMNYSRMIAAATRSF